MTAVIKPKLVTFAKGKKGRNVRFVGKKVYTKGKASGRGHCQDLVDLGLKTVGGRMGNISAAPRKGMLVVFEKHFTKLKLAIYSVKNGKKDRIYYEDAEMSRPDHIAIIDDVVLQGKKLWIWEQNVTPDKRTVRQPVRNDKHYVAAKKTFPSNAPISDVKKFVEMKLDYHATARIRSSLKKNIDWDLIQAWKDTGVGLFVELDLKSSGKVKIFDVVKDDRPE